jgi:hypothetical protein
LKRFKTATILCLILATQLLGCKNYSFTGTTLSPDYKTIVINNVVMGTAGGPADLTQKFTEKLKEYYQRNTNLKRKTAEGDLILDGTIVGYEIGAAAQTSSDKANLNRLTIRVEVRFKNNKYDKESFEKEFTFFQDYSAEQTLIQAERTIVPKILDQLVLDIFNKTAANW